MLSQAFTRHLRCIAGTGKSLDQNADMAFHASRTMHAVGGGGRRGIVFGVFCLYTYTLSHRGSMLCCPVLCVLCFVPIWACPRRGRREEWGRGEGSLDSEQQRTRLAGGI